MPLTETANQITVSVVYDRAALGSIPIHQVGVFVKTSLANALANKMIARRMDYETKTGHTDYTSIYTARINVFTDEELKQHDQDVIEEFCSRKD